MATVRITTRYRVVMDKTTGSIKPGFVDDDGRPHRFDETKEITYFDDRFYDVIAETSRDRMIGLITGKEIEKETQNEKSALKRISV